MRTIEMMKATIMLQNYRCQRLKIPPMYSLGLNHEQLVQFQKLNGFTNAEIIILIGNWYKKYTSPQAIPGVEGVC